MTFLLRAEVYQKAFIVTSTHPGFAHRILRETKKTGSRNPGKSGSEGRIRTCDQVINSHLRYRCATSERYVFRLSGKKKPRFGRGAFRSFVIGSEGRIRTCDQVINSHLRYRCATSEQGLFHKEIGGG